MPLNKLENFIKNTDGRTIYVNPADLNATDSITNQGTSLTEPFRTVQRALIEAARFSYVRGNDNDLIEKTTIVLYPGEHTIDNRPGWGIKLDPNGNPVARTPGGEELDVFSSFNLTEDTNFDIESDNNVLYRYNSIYGGVIVPRGTSIVGMDLRKTKIRPRYVPNPTDPAVPDSAIFRITGTCYFWQFTIFDGLETTPVFTDRKDFSTNNKSIPTFSHHKLTAFEYADGVNPAIAEGFELTDLAMYYSKLGNAYNEASGRPIDEKFPVDSEGFAPQRPEFEIVGAFATDPVRISRIISGDGFTPDAVITVDTIVPHELSVGTPIKIRGVAVDDYNVSTKVAAILSPTRFTYSLALVRPNLPASPSVANANVTVETDTVTGASPYIFNVSMRSVWGINGMHADGAKATGFRSMVVAQFTAISLQKDDRAFVKYNKQARVYDGINVSTPVRGADLSALSSSTNTVQVYHLDPEAVYRPEWDTTHIKMSNDAVIQIVSVFAIGFNQHFGAISGADASITNSNSNFGQFALLADGFKNDAFDKDDQGFITSVITPNNAFNPETDARELVEWVNIDFELTRQIAFPNQLYLQGYTNVEDKPPTITQGFRLGANYDERLYQPTSTGQEISAQIRMLDELIDAGNPQASLPSEVGRKVYDVESGPTNNILTITGHGLLPGEKVRVLSAIGDLPENIEKGQLYYVNVIDANQIRISSSESNALNAIPLRIFGGEQLRVESRVNDKEAGDPGHPMQYDPVNQNWFVHTNFNSGIYQYISAGDGRPNRPGVNDGADFVSNFLREADNRNLDDKLYRLRYVVPKEARNAKPPTPGYVIQESSSTGARSSDDFTRNTIEIDDYEYNRNPRFIVDCFVDGIEVQVRSEIPHDLDVGDKIKLVNVESDDNIDAVPTRGYNGEFLVTEILDARRFRYSITDVNGFTRSPGTFINNTNQRDLLLPRFEKKDNQINVFVYRIEAIVDFEEGIRDGIYHLFCVNGGNSVGDTFTNRKYNQPIEDLYPQLDTDNLRNNPESSVTFAANAPLGKTTIDEQQSSITRETLDKLYEGSKHNIVTGINTSLPGVGGTYTSVIEFDREHNFNGVYSYTTLSPSSGYTDGVYYNVRLLTQSDASWRGATAKVTVSSGQVTDLTITDNGSGYSDGDVLLLNPSDIGSGSGGNLSISASDIENNVDALVHFNGGGSQFPSFHTYITDIISPTEIEVVQAPTTPLITEGMYVVPTDSTTRVTSTSYDPGDETTTFNSGVNGFGLQRGNSFVVYDSIGNQLGRYYVKEILVDGSGNHSMTAVTEAELNDVSRIGKTGFEDNDASTGFLGENIGVRGVTPFDLGTFYLETESGTGSEITVRAKDGGTTGSVGDKLFLGRYLQINSEFLRVSGPATGIDGNIVPVIRGALGTNIRNHPVNSKIRTIKPDAIELRRPSILRASGHTFEYLGYGPGNYSTSLPQLQVRQLPDDEVYLVQSQELSCGQVVYTGMSDNGDFYIGNTKYSATSGTQTTFDVPIPTVAGQLAASNSVVFDEVIINRRLFVAGGETNEVLSQFDGPVKFTNSVTIQARLSVSDVTSTQFLSVNSTDNSTAPTNGALQVRGGAGIERDLYVGGKIDVENLDVGNDLSVGGDVNLDQASILYAQQIQPVNNGADVILWTNQNNNTDISIGGNRNNNKVIFNTTKPGSGEGGADDIDNSDGGVDIKGSLVVREKVIAKEFIGDGLGKPGSIIMWGGNATEDNEQTAGSIPKGYLLCNGRTLNRNSYPKLFNAIRYTHGGSGNNFRLPDLRNRFIAGAGSSYNVGSTGGANTVSLNTSQMPSHSHGVNSASTAHGHNWGGNVGNANVGHNHGGNVNGAGGHGHGINFGGGGHGHNSQVNGGSHGHGNALGGVNASRQGFDANGGNEAVKSINTNNRGIDGGGHNHGINFGGGGHGHNTQVNGGGHNHGLSIGNANSTQHNHNVNGNVSQNNSNHNHSTNNAGSGNAHENRPPYFALCYIIQYK